MLTLFIASRTSDCRYKSPKIVAFHRPKDPRQSASKYGAARKWIALLPFFGGLWCSVSMAAENSLATQQASSVVGLKAIASPALGTPIGYGASWGSVGVGAFAHTVRAKGDPRDVDGSVGFAFGLGNSTRNVGLEISTSITSVTNQSGDGPGEVGQAGAKLHTVFKGDWALAIGAESLAAWGGLKGQPVSGYLAITKVTGIHLADRSFPIVLSLGAGQGRFGKLDSAANAQDDRYGAFGSIGFYISPRLSIVVDSTTNITTAGISLVPIRSLPVTVALVALNLRQQFDTPTEFGISIGSGFNWD